MFLAEGKAKLHYKKWTYTTLQCELWVMVITGTQTKPLYLAPYRTVRYGIVDMSRYHVEQNVTKSRYISREVQCGTAQCSLLVRGCSLADHRCTMLNHYVLHVYAPMTHWWFRSLTTNWQKAPWFQGKQMRAQSPHSKDPAKGKFNPFCKP